RDYPRVRALPVSEEGMLPLPRVAASDRQAEAEASFPPETVEAHPISSPVSSPESGNPVSATIPFLSRAPISRFAAMAVHDDAFVSRFARPMQTSVSGQKWTHNNDIAGQGFSDRIGQTARALPLPSRQHTAPREESWDVLSPTEAPQSLPLPSFPQS